MNNEGQRTSREVIEQKLSQNTTVMDATGETIGVVTGYDMQGGYMDVGGGTLFATETRIPLAAIGDTGASGVYLTGTKDELAQQYGGDVGAAMETARPAQPVAQAPTPAPEQARRQAQSTAQTRTDDTITVPVFEEQLVVGKQRQETGRVHLHKEVVTEQQSIPVTLRHEEVTVERVAFTGQTSAADLKNAFQDQDFEVKVMGEEAVVGKQAHVVEEVRLHKDDTQEQQQVTGTVRKERVVVDETDTTQSQTRTPRRG